MGANRQDLRLSAVLVNGGRVPFRRWIPSLKLCPPRSSSHSAFGGHCHDRDAHRHLRVWLRAPDKPHERLAAATASACCALKLWWSAEIGRLAYSEWQLEAAFKLPRMIRRWDKNRGHQRHGDDASSAAAGQLLISSSLPVRRTRTRRQLEQPEAAGCLCHSVLPQCQCAPQAH
jgi:hypothetical protein